MQYATTDSRASLQANLRLLGLSAVGIFIFFIPVTLAGKTSIPLDHMVGWLRTALGDTGAGWYAMAMILAGALHPLVSGQWRRSLTDKIFMLLKWLGVIAGALALTGAGPARWPSPARGRRHCKPRTCCPFCLTSW